MELELMKCKTYSEIKAVFHGTSARYTKAIKKIKTLLSFPCGRQQTTLQGRQHYLGALHVAKAPPCPRKKLELAAYLALPAGTALHRAAGVPLHDAILCGAVPQIPFRGNRKRVRISTYASRKNTLSGVFQGADEKCGNSFVGRATIRTCMTCINTTGHVL